MLKETEAQGQVVDHLGLVATVIARLGLIEKIDARLKVSKDKGAVSYTHLDVYKRQPLIPFPSAPNFV